MTDLDEIVDTYRALRAQRVPFWIGGRPDARDQRVLIKRTAQACGVSVEVVEATLNEASFAPPQKACPPSQSVGSNRSSGISPDLGSRRFEAHQVSDCYSARRQDLEPIERTRSEVVPPFRKPHSGSIQ